MDGRCLRWEAPSNVECFFFFRPALDQFRRSRAGKKPPTGYYDSHGSRLRAYLDMPRTLEPLASSYVVVETDDIRGGVGANFLVRWQTETPVPPPVVEMVMITTESTQGISFRSTARVLYEERASVDTLGQ